MRIWVPSMECLWCLLDLSKQVGLDRGIVKQARTAKAALVTNMVKNMALHGLTVADMLTIAKWS